MRSSAAFPLAGLFFADEMAGLSRGSSCVNSGPTYFPAPDWVTYPGNDAFACVDDPVEEHVCMTRAEVEQAFATQPEVLSSLHARFDLPAIHIESQSSASNQITTQVFRMLAHEVGGYRIKHTVNMAFGTPLFRCTGGQYDFHLEAWKTDYSDDDWNAAFFGTDGRAPEGCHYGGINGASNQNSWWVDSSSVIKGANTSSPTEQPLSLDFWRSYTTAAGVAGLQLFNVTEARLNPAAWDFPEWCDTNKTDSVPCGVITVIAKFFEPGVTIAQIRNLKMRLAVFYPATFDIFYELTTARIRAGQQALIMIGALSPYVTSAYWQRVTLPRVTPACINAATTSDTVYQYDCDYRAQTLHKFQGRAIEANSDYHDAVTLFSRLQFSTEQLAEAESKMTHNFNPPDVACQWIKENPKLWTPWFGIATPRVHTVKLTEGVAYAVYALAGIFAVCTLAGMGFLFKYRAHPMIRRASHMFCQLMMLGAALFYATLVIGVQPESLAMCTVAQFLFSAAFSLFYGSLLIKTWRIYLIFNSKQLQMQRLPDSSMVCYLLAYSSVDLLLVVLWAAISPPTATLHGYNTDTFARITLCDSEHTVVFSTALYVWRGLAVLAGGVLAVRIRGVDDDFSESKFLGAACYNILGVSLIVLGLSLMGSRAPDVAAISWLIGVTLAVFCSSVIFIVPKWQGVFGTQTPIRYGVGANGGAGGRHGADLAKASVLSSEGGGSSGIKGGQKVNSGVPPSPKVNRVSPATTALNTAPSAASPTSPVRLHVAPRSPGPAGSSAAVAPLPSEIPEIAGAVQDMA